MTDKINERILLRETEHFNNFKKISPKIYISYIKIITLRWRNRADTTKTKYLRLRAPVVKQVDIMDSQIQ